MKLAVVGHVEWVEFVRVERAPAPGEIVHATEVWEEAGGGGAVAVAELVRLAGEATLFTALGNDALGVRAAHQLEEAGVRVHATTVDEPQRRAVVFIDERGERTIAVLGDKQRPRGRDHTLPWHELAQADAVYFVSGDARALRAARRSRTLVATSRELATLREGGIELDAVVGSGEDEGERLRPGELDPVPKLVVTTAGALGGWSQPGGPYRAAEIPGLFEDAYGCGDCFAAGLTFALADGLPSEEAIAFAARCGAAALARRGALGLPHR